MKRIILTVTNDLSYDQRMHKICGSLSSAGYAVELVGRELPSSVPLEPQSFHQTRLKCWFNKGKLFYAEYNIRLFFFLVFSQFDAACAIDLDTVLAVFFAGTLKGVPLAYDAHEYFTEVPEVIRRRSVKMAWKWIERTFAPRFNLWYTVSSGLANLFKQEYGKNVHVIMNVPLLKETSLPANYANDKFIIYQGALNESRGLEHLIEAMKDLDCKLKLIGEGDLSQKLRTMVNELGLQHKIEFLGFIGPSKLNAITLQAFVGFNVSENKGLSYYYSLSNKFFDYIHAGLPQICNDFPEYQHINDKYHVALLTKDSSVVEIKTNIARLLSNQQLYEELKKNCEVCRRDFNWQLEEKKLLGLYDQLFR